MTGMSPSAQARGSAGQAPGTRDLEQGEEQVLEAINRERTGAGRSPAGKLTVPLLKEHLRGKVLGGAAVRPGAKKRDELIGAFRCSWLPCSRTGCQRHAAWGRLGSCAC